MAINFPNSPSNGATHTVGNITYVYDSAKGLWKDSPAGLTQGIDALTDVDISTSAPTNGQILEYNSTSGKFVPADSSAGVTVYATINDLPLTGVTEGSMALVDSTDKLYIFSDTGWYSIALVNTSPSISGVNPSYTLAMDGTALTISVTASDPEGIPITYSIVSDTSGNIATVAQGTGSNTNQWTITPSTNTAHAGNFTLVFRASDGTNVASASSTFTLAFAHIDSKYTTMLLTSVGANNGVNNSYTDSSASAHTITRNGDTNQVAYSPYRHGGYSTYFDGTGDNLVVADHADLDGFSGDFTLEFWFYATSSGDWRTLLTKGTSATTGPYLIYQRNANIALYLSSNGTGHDIASGVIVSTGGVTLNTWHHFALSRDGNSYRSFLNGSLVNTITSSSGLVANSQNVGIGAANNGTEAFTGYMRDVRIVNGTAIYTTNFTPPTEPLQAVTNTSLLTCHLPYIADGSTNGHSITVNAAIEPWAPYDNRGYTASDNGGSAFFDGTGDYLGIPDDAGFDMDGEYAIEFWFYSYGTQPNSYPTLFGTKSSSWGAGAMGLRYSPTGYSRKVALVRNGYNNVATGYAIVSTNTFSEDSWHHVALTRDSSDNWRLFVNGKAEGTAITATDDHDWAHGGGAMVGANVWDGNYSYFAGNISDLRVVKGSVVYTGNFTPPTGPLTQTGGTYSSTTNVNTSITSGHTKLLLPCDDASIIDKSQSIRDIRVVGSLVSSSTQTKFGSTSIKYNGSDARAFLRTGDLFKLGTGEFTVECWLYKDATGTGMILDARPSNSGAPWLLGVSTTEYVFFYDGSSYTASVALSQNTWTHIAVTRDSSNVLRIFLDGTIRHTTNSYTANLTATDQTVTGVNAGYPSDYISGYIEDLRVTKGKAHYTANFTAPTAALDA